MKRFCLIIPFIFLTLFSSCATQNNAKDASNSTINYTRNQKEVFAKDKEEQLENKTESSDKSINVSGKPSVPR